MKTFPQWLRPRLFCGIYGTAKAMPFQNWVFFNKL